MTVPQGEKQTLLMGGLWSMRKEAEMWGPGAENSAEGSPPVEKMTTGWP